MAEDSNGWHVDLDQADTIIVEVFPSLNCATLSFESVDGPLDDATWEFEDFPVRDFFDSGLNIIGPWLNRHGLAYDSWLEPAPSRYEAMAYRYEGPEVDLRVVARRAGG